MNKKGNIDRRLGIEDEMLFMMVSPEFYETLSNYIPKNHNYRNEIESFVPQDWGVIEEDIWYYFFPKKTEIPNQGFKIHISSTPTNASAILRKTALVCFKENTAFKVVKDRILLEIINSRNYGRESSGKFITIYPSNIELFKRICEKLYQSLKNFEGPFILSDMPYKDSRVVFYRYGGFKKIFMLNVYGEKIPGIISPEGKFVEDIRTPFYKLPSWVRDPFAQRLDFPKRIILNNKYEVLSPIISTNAGGVYKAMDIKTKKKVIIKERRPFIGKTDQFKIDEVSLLIKEYEILKKIEGCPYVPKAIEIFKEWEHYFLVLEFLPGFTLSEYRALEEFNIMLQTNLNEKTRKKFCETFAIISENLIKAVKTLHDHGIICADLSPNNVIYNPKDRSIKIIDLEGAYVKGLPYMPIGTMGFVRKKKNYLKKPTFKDDYFAVSNILYNLIFPIQQLFMLSSNNKRKFLSYILKDKELPQDIENLIFLISKNKNPESYKEIIKKIKNVRILRNKRKKKENKISINFLKKTTHSIAEYIKNNISCQRKDRLFPSDPRIFVTNPLNISYGALGNCLFLKEINNEIPKNIVEWIKKQFENISINNYPPGLGVGLAGVAIGLYEIGQKDIGLKAMEICYKSPLYLKSLDLFYGICGCGLASLYFYKKTGDTKFLEKAQEAGYYILKNIKEDKYGCFFENTDGIVYFGFMHGASGLAYFLLRLYSKTKDDKFLSFAEKLIHFEISHSIKRKKYICWSKYRGSNILLPYFRFGNAGIGSVLIRFYNLTGEKNYKKMAEMAAEYLRKKYSISPSLYMGMAGIGEFFLDMFTYTDEEKYLREAHWVARRIMLFGIKRESGLTFPGENLGRISTDYGTGSSGIGLFFERLIKKGKKGRFFYDIL